MYVCMDGWMDGLKTGDIVFLACRPKRIIRKKMQKENRPEMEILRLEFNIFFVCFSSWMTNLFFFYVERERERERERENKKQNNYLPLCI